VDDIRPHVASADVSVIPLRVGSGTRIKAFEAMAMGRPVVSTRIGTEGLDITPGTHFLEHDTPEAFADAVVSLLENPQAARAMARAARDRLEERFSWGHVARQFEAICARAIQTKR
jgi:glycosyltransferase involved in cell wall biosynthesis